MTENKPAPPYSAYFIHGDSIFVSGTVGRDASGNIAADDMAAQTKQTLENISQRLKDAGSSMDKVVKVTVFITDMSRFGELNGVYRPFFGEVPPARSCVEVCKLPDPEAIVEIEVIAGR
jgi:2-iminobutanoate/2-iminopropanoate deaminase